VTRGETAQPASATAVEKTVFPEAANPVPSHFKPERLTVLIVEDNRDMRAYIRSILEEQYNIFEAEHGAEALTVLTGNHVDFIICDLMMPVMDGLELSRKVKQNFSLSHIPFLMLTAKTSQEARLESYRTGVDEYLQKPFSEDLLLTRMTNILENRRRQQQRFAMNMEARELQIEEKSSDGKFVDKALETIRANYKNSYYEASDFIDAMGASKSVVNKKMQSLTGQSIGQFIRNYRLNIACEMIKKNRVTHNMNISEIAYEVGFNDPKYFTRCFTKRYGMAPSSLLEEEHVEI
jgi:CheY-like chemotaxis protein